MHILLVNDDGIHGQGLHALCRAALEAGHRVSLCAPDRERSASGHSITLNRPLRAEKVDVPGTENAWAADGTPADCARLGLYLAPDVDAVISGINNGPNLGGACVYSGTVAAAMEAAMSGVPALASSMGAYGCEDYALAAELTVRVAEWMMDHPLRRGELYNLNIPVVGREALRGVAAATLAPIYLDSAVYAPVQTPEGVRYQYAPGENVPLDDPDGDVRKIRENYATLTKLTWDCRAAGDAPDVASIRF